MTDKSKASFAVRKFLKFDEHDDLDFVVPVKGFGKFGFDLMVHPCADDKDGVIIWFEFKEL